MTGSVGGLGHTIAKTLAAQGSQVILHGLESPHEVQDAIAAIKSFDVPVFYFQVNLEDPSAIEQMFAEVSQRFGGVDILVNNAVTRHFSPLESFPTQAWERALKVNVSAPFHTARLALPSMRRSGWGRIINMTSVYGERGTVNRIDYVTCKAALAGMTRAIAAEVAGQGVTCNSVCPGSVLTPSIEKRLNQLMAERGIEFEEATREFLLGKQPVPKFIPAEHVAQLILFLCSQAAGEMNGVNLPMDSGWLAT